MGEGRVGVGKGGKGVNCEGSGEGWMAQSQEGRTSRTKNRKDSLVKKMRKAGKGKGMGRSD